MASRGLDVWFSGRRLCAKMPALILIGSWFEPLWRQDGAAVEDRGVVCVNPWRGKWTIIRVGSGWGRSRGARYYLVDFDTKTVTRLKRVPTKNIYTREWMDCVILPPARGTTMCFEWKDGKIVRGPVKYM